MQAMHHSPGMYSLFFSLRLFTIHEPQSLIVCLAVHHPGVAHSTFRLSSLMYRTDYRLCDAQPRASSRSTIMHSYDGVEDYRSDHMLADGAARKRSPEGAP
jgi:hypothetical protein